MRVANIIEESRIGGPQIRNINIAKSLKGQIDVTLIFPKENSSALKRQCYYQGVKNISLSLTTIKKNMVGIFLYILFFPLEVIILARTLKKYSFDLVHVSGGSWQCKGIFAAKLAGIKVIWELNDTYSPAIVRKIFFFFSHLANGFIFASERTKKYYKKLIPINRKRFIIQSPVDIGYFNPRLNYPVDRFIDKKIKKKIIIGTVANVNPVKDIKLFVEAAKELSFFSEKVIFIVVGRVYKSQKKYFKNLNSLIKRFFITNFYFLNAREDTRSLLKNMDIYVCTSKNESSPLSVWEAMSMEKAIISTNVGDVGRFIKNKVNGFIINVGRTDELTESIKKLIKQPKLRKKFGKISRQIAKNKLNLKNCSNLHAAAYKDIAS